MEELKAMFRVCVYTKSDGNRCNSPALTGANFCFQHAGGSVSALTRARSTYNTKLNLAYPGDRESIQLNLFLVAQALSEGTIDTIVANTYNRLFRTCEQNLHRWEKAKQEKRMPPLPKETPESNNQRPSFTNEPDGGPFKPASGLSGEHKMSGEQEPDGEQKTEPSVSSASSVVNDNSSVVNDNPSHKSNSPASPQTRDLTREESRASIDAFKAEYYAYYPSPGTAR